MHGNAPDLDILEIDALHGRGAIHRADGGGEIEHQTVGIDVVVGQPFVDCGVFKLFGSLGIFRKAVDPCPLDALGLCGLLGRKHPRIQDRGCEEDKATKNPGRWLVGIHRFSADKTGTERQWQ